MYDILSTTSNKTMIKGVYRDELPVVYEAPKPEKIIFTKDDLYKADTFAFGSIIGSITNKSTSAYALLPIIEKEYGKDSAEFSILESRLQQCCKAQSAQIDKTKIGKEVKGIPKIWIQKQPTDIVEFEGKENAEEIVKQNEVYNHILLNKYPYFFRYLYKDANDSYRKYYQKYDTVSKRKFKMTLKDLLTLKEKDEQQIEFINSFYEYIPLIYSDSPMNLLCRYLETTNADIADKLKIDTSMKCYELYRNNKIAYTEDTYNKVKSVINIYMRSLKNKFSNVSVSSFTPNEDTVYVFDENFDIKESMLEIHKDINVIVNCLVDYFYIERPSANKDVLWKLYGNVMFQNIKKNTKSKIQFPMPDDDGDIVYMGARYSWKEIKID